MPAASRVETNRGQICDAIHLLPQPLRGRLMFCASLSERVGQLQISHPFLLVALTSPQRPLAARTDAIRMIEDGRPLAEIAALLGVPMCFRRVPLEACCSGLMPVRWSETANVRLGPHVPEEPSVAALWLRAITLGHTIAGEDFAIWLAQQRTLYLLSRLERLSIMGIGLHAWHSGNPDRTPFPASPFDWTAQIAIREAIVRARAWLKRVRLWTELGCEGIADTWLPAGAWHGYTFHPLASPLDLLTEAEVMGNCVAIYGELIAGGISRLFSVRRHGRRVATLEVRRTPGEGILALNEIKGPGNDTCEIEVLRAAIGWLDAQPKELVSGYGWSGREGDETTSQARHARWRAMLDAYGVGAAGRQAVWKGVEVSALDRSLQRLRRGLGCDRLD